MFTRLKFHLIAITAISLIVLVLYRLIGPAQPVAAPSALATGQYVHVISASWGLNCNPDIEETLRERANAPLPTDEHGNVVPHEPLSLMARDNVLATAQAICHGKPACEIFASNGMLKLDPIARCFKKLDLSYRCFEMDKLHITQTDQGELLKLDCTTPAAAPHATAPAASQP